MSVFEIYDEMFGGSGSPKKDSYQELLGTEGFRISGGFSEKDIQTGKIRSLAEEVGRKELKKLTRKEREMGLEFEGPPSFPIDRSWTPYERQIWPPINEKSRRESKKVIEDKKELMRRWGPGYKPENFRADPSVRALAIAMMGPEYLPPRLVKAMRVQGREVPQWGLEDVDSIVEWLGGKGDRSPALLPGPIDELPEYNKRALGVVADVRALQQGDRYKLGKRLNKMQVTPLIRFVNRMMEGIALSELPENEAAKMVGAPLKILNPKHYFAPRLLPDAAPEFWGSYVESLEHFEKSALARYQKLYQRSREKFLNSPQNIEKASRAYDSYIEFLKKSRESEESKKLALESVPPRKEFIKKKLNDWFGRSITLGDEMVNSLVEDIDRLHGSTYDPDTYSERVRENVIRSYIQGKDWKKYAVRGGSSKILKDVRDQQQKAKNKFKKDAYRADVLVKDKRNYLRVALARANYLDMKRAVVRAKQGDPIGSVASANAAYVADRAYRSPNPEKKYDALLGVRWRLYDYTKKNTIAGTKIEEMVSPEEIEKVGGEDSGSDEMKATVSDRMDLDKKNWIYANKASNFPEPEPNLQRRFEDLAGRVLGNESSSRERDIFRFVMGMRKSAIFDDMTEEQRKLLRRLGRTSVAMRAVEGRPFRVKVNPKKLPPDKQVLYEVLKQLRLIAKVVR